MHAGNWTLISEGSKNVLDRHDIGLNPPLET